jgi:hypothetical protein
MNFAEVPDRSSNGLHEIIRSTHAANRHRQLTDPVRKVPTVVGQVFTGPRLTASSGAQDDERTSGRVLRSKKLVKQRDAMLKSLQ